MAATLNQLKSRRLCAARCSRSRNGRMDARTGRAGKVERETACMLYTHTISTRYGTHRQTQHTIVLTYLPTLEYWWHRECLHAWMPSYFSPNGRILCIYSVFIKYFKIYNINICYGSVINKCRTKISNWNVFNRFGILFLPKTFKIKILA